MDTQKLRQRILDLAIRGKLLPQDPNDEPASVLLDRIRAEKERLIAEGKLKRPKAKKSTDKSHYQQFTPPFDIPDSWEWVRLGDVCDVARGGSPRPIKSYLTYRVDGINWIKIGDTEKDGKFINSTKERIIPEGALKSRLVHKGDFLLTNSMSFGRPYILNIDGCIHDGWLVISPIGNVFDKDFLYLLLSSEYAYYQFSEKASGSAVSNLNSDKVAESIFPLPPLETQRIIVRECEKLTSFAQTIDNEKKDLEITIALTKSKILDLAMQGKLVPQDPADEPAADMLRRVNPKAKIITDNPHYTQLPDNWVYLSLSDINTYKSSTVTPANMPEQLFDLYSVPIFSTLTPENIHGGEIGSAKQVINKGDVLLCKINPHLNRVWEIIEDSHNVQIASSEWIVVRSELHHPSFLKWYFNSPEFRALLSSQVSGVGGSLTRAQPAIVKGYLVPVPPMEEQARISKAIEHWFECLDSIISGLSN